MQNLEKKFSPENVRRKNLPTLTDDIKTYTIRDLEDPIENKHSMICDRTLLLDLRNMRELLEDFIEKDRNKLDKIAIMKMILEQLEHGK